MPAKEADEVRGKKTEVCTTKLLEKDFRESGGGEKKWRNQKKGSKSEAVRPVCL